LCGSTIGAELAGRRFLRSTPGFRVETVTCLWLRVFVISRLAPSGDAIEIAVSGRISAETNAGCGCHLYELDAATLSAECQQPCQPSFRGVAGRIEFLAPQRFVDRRRSVGGNLVRGCSTRPRGSLRSDANSAPRVRQLCAKGCERRSPLWAGSVHRGETVQPCQQNVSNPVSRVSVALSQRICAGGTDRMEKLQKHALTGENRVNGNQITLC
jgi:hypothetical protein